MPRCSVILVTYNSGAQIEGCVRALATQDCEIIVVDNASQDDTVARVKALAERVPLQLLTISRNIGFAAGVNQGVRAASGAVLLILNPDAVAEAGAINAIEVCMTASLAGAAGGALLESDGQPARGFAFRRIPTLTSLIFEALLVNQVWPRNPLNRRYRCLDADYSKPQQIEQPAGACLAVTRKAWDAIQGMDPAFYPVWFEDVDFCKRLLQQGTKIVYCPDARFRHSGAHSVGRLAFGDKQMFWYVNMLHYARKHFSGAKVLLLRMGIFAGMGLRVLACAFGATPEGVPGTVAIGSYARVAMRAFGLGEPADDKRTAQN